MTEYQKARQTYLEAKKAMEVATSRVVKVMENTIHNSSSPVLNSTLARMTGMNPTLIGTYLYNRTDVHRVTQKKNQIAILCDESGNPTDKKIVLTRKYAAYVPTTYR